MESVSWLVYTGMSSLVAKGSPDSAFRAHCPNFKLYGWREGRANACSRLRNQRDLADAAFDLQTDGRRSFAVGLVRVLVIVVAQPVRVHRANSAGSVHHNADFAGQANGCLAHVTFQIRHEIGFAIAGEIEIHLSGTHAHIQPRHRHIAQSQMAAPGTHLDFQLQRYVIAEAQVPVVMCSSEVRGRVVLRDAEMPDAIGDAVLDARSFVGTTVVEIGIEQMARATANVEFARARLQRDVHGFGALPI